LTAYLLTWKPGEWGYASLKERIDQFGAGETTHRWSCGTTRKMLVGSRVFLMKQGSGGGIFGSGSVVSEPFEEEHYNDEKRAAGKSAWYIMVKFDRLYDPVGGIKIDTNELKALDDQRWQSQGSGKKISDDLAVQLEARWGERVGYTSIPYPDDEDAGGYVEGSKKTITVNAYERSPEAREKCIAHWGVMCAVCKFDFRYFYGELGRGYIHVHHLRPLSEVGGEYEVDPVNDLRPVCPNCHSMLHRERPALSIEELTTVVGFYGKRVK
jgi:5-methylcytosine-specific restriction protein A